MIASDLMGSLATRKWIGKNSKLFSDRCRRNVEMSSAGTGSRLSRTTYPCAGIQLGNVFVGIQPPRGYSLQPQAIYHSPTLPPPPEYLAFYLWIRETFGAHAVVHLGKHGNLEWLPGRSVALGEDDYPWLCLGSLPHFYPFIVNNPGEGSQAKRRTAAVIVDHLTPPLTRAGLYGDLEKVERLLEEHAHCLSLYPSRATELEREIGQTLEHSSWAQTICRAAQSRSKRLAAFSAISRKVRSDRLCTSWERDRPGSGRLIFC